MKKLLTLALALVVLAVFPTLGVAQERAIQPIEPPIDGSPSLRCCECLGQDVKPLDLRTGIEPWTVGGPGAMGPTPTTLSAWTASAPPAKWIQPVAPATPTASKNIAAGTYTYEVKFNVPKCIIPFGTLQLAGSYAADNSAKVLGSPISTCAGPTCFKSLTSFTQAVPPTPGLHTLKVEVTNNETYSGLLLNAKVTGQCKKK